MGTHKEEGMTFDELAKIVEEATYFMFKDFDYNKAINLIESNPNLTRFDKIKFKLKMAYKKRINKK